MPAPTLTPHQLHDMGPVRMLDVRTPGEFETVHINEAANIPLHEIDRYTEQLVATHPHPLVVVCQSGNRAHKAAQTLIDHGATNVHVLDGGMAAWTAERRPAVTGRQRWAMERQVRLVAGSIVLVSLMASRRVPRSRYIAAGIGAGLSFSAMTNTCAMANVLGRLPYNHPASTDSAAAVAALVTENHATTLR
ncbi:rhodanese-like domain-containing protein [Allobranchiibius sp. GilTou73]|uniref:rhodanese-like domain-containing protein n=1 Tax=Allobranchiibius sp. GilTou73 TaxID=2904523 RepID=UPI001F4534E2|nr:rhodanese-like domain-containing protein [Allobranchiibius sp. GilTou73]UIJ33753.1 rhodanese-like domain-containing protein [Allobranchiibius sp. GilTou73]